MPARTTVSETCPATRTDLPTVLADFELPASYQNRKASARARNAARARAASHRRRLVDPTTCNVDYSAAQLEFMLAMQAYKQARCRPYPTCNEVLKVFEGLGYHKSARRVAGGAGKLGK